ncbi:unnamed protein product [Prorocentrum cordatum]|uniref:Uncharacterized protein n=1 Tax=Prorocentrum cordatum TaxID=2364126 RepID=A0ABN9X3H6_9DINO|nr:unnamed protein product [Polarella glacialis]
MSWRPLARGPSGIAPEVLLNKGHGKPVDWWTLGILVYEMIVGYPPFVDEDPMGIYQKILSGKIVFPKVFNKEAKGLVKKLLTADLGKRYGNLKNGVDDIKQHKWFQSIVWSELLSKKIPSPFKPKVASETDTSNFDEYPDSDEQPPSVPAGQDPCCFCCSAFSSPPSAALPSSPSSSPAPASNSLLLVLLLFLLLLLVTSSSDLGRPA